MVKIPASDAAKLVNKPVPIPNASGYNSGYYLIGLDVFHQLHCLVFFLGPLVNGI